MPSIKIRFAKKEDCEWLWKLVNDTEVRKASFSKDYIPWKKHLEWFKSKLKDPNIIIYIGLDNRGKPFGQVRFEIDSREAEISVSIDKEYRGKGYGSRLIKKTCLSLFASTEIETISANIRIGNEKSIKSFKKVGFQEIRNKNTNESKKNCMQLRK